MNLSFDFPKHFSGWIFKLIFKTLFPPENSPGHALLPTFSFQTRQLEANCQSNPERSSLTSHHKWRKTGEGQEEKLFSYKPELRGKPCWQTPGQEQPIPLHSQPLTPEHIYGATSMKVIPFHTFSSYKKRRNNIYSRRGPLPPRWILLAGFVVAPHWPTARRAPGNIWQSEYYSC